MIPAILNYLEIQKLCSKVIIVIVGYNWLK